MSERLGSGNRSRALCCLEGVCFKLQSLLEQSKEKEKAMMMG